MFAAITCFNQLTMNQILTLWLDVLDSSFVKNIYYFFLSVSTQYNLALHHINLLLQFKHVFKWIRFIITKFDNTLFLGC